METADLTQNNFINPQESPDTLTDRAMSCKLPLLFRERSRKTHSSHQELHKTTNDCLPGQRRKTRETSVGKTPGTVAGQETPEETEILTYYPRMLLIVCLWCFVFLKRCLLCALFDFHVSQGSAQASNEIF